MTLPLIEFSTDNFTYHAQAQTFVSEASEMENRHLQRMYDDACDVGFSMKSSKTGRVVVYVLVDTVIDDDDGIQYWIFEPTAESVRKHPECVGTKVKVFND